MKSMGKACFTKSGSDPKSKGLAHGLMLDARSHVLSHDFRASATTI